MNGSLSLTGAVDLGRAEMLASSRSRSLTDAATRAAAAGRDEEAAERFEALFATQLVKELRRALPEGSFFQGAGADTYDSWLDQHLGDALASSDSLGLAGMIKTALARSSGDAFGSASR